MIDMNALQQLMAFADKNHAFDIYNTSGSGFQPTQFNVPKMKLDWAMSMLGGGQDGGQQHQMPDFFGGGANGNAPPAYAPPQRMSAKQMPSYQAPDRSASQNYLASVMKRYG